MMTESGDPEVALSVSSTGPEALRTCGICCDA